MSSRGSESLIYLVFAIVIGTLVLQEGLKIDTYWAFFFVIIIALLVMFRGKT